MESPKTLLVACACLMIGLPAVSAAEDSLCGRCCLSCGRRICCPRWVTVKETKSCWEVECREVCIPAVRFPWQKCGNSHCISGCEECPPRCGRVRVVRVLKKKDYEIERRICEWDIHAACEAPADGSLFCDDCLRTTAGRASTKPSWSGDRGKAERAQDPRTPGLPFGPAPAIPTHR